MRFRVLDIETILDESVWTKGEPRWKWVGGLDDLYDKYGGIVAIGKSPRLVAEDQFPPPQANRVVALAFVDVVMDPGGSPRYRFDRVRSVCSWPATGDPREADEHEVRILRWFDEYMLKGPSCGELPTLVTWNGRGFDLPVLTLRGLKHGVPFGWYYKERNMRYRYSEEGHLDLMDFLGDYGAARNMKLSDVCHLVGLPGKLDVHGGQVFDVVAGTRARPETLGSEVEKIRRYCAQDVIQTALVFLRTRHHLGKISAQEHDACAATFRDHPEIADYIPEIQWDKFMLGGRSS